MGKDVIFGAIVSVIGAFAGFSLAILLLPVVVYVIEFAACLFAAAVLVFGICYFIKENKDD